MTDHNKMLSEINIDIFNSIRTQLSLKDKTSLLSIQKAIRDSNENYCYLEIGSYLGGSIQPYLVDEKSIMSG